METTNSYTNEKIEFRQIVLGHIKRILDLSSHELRDTTFVISHGNYSETKYQEDTRFSYIQAIENLAYVLKSYFDKEMNDIYEECINVINGFGYEIREKFKSLGPKLMEETGKNNLSSVFVLEMRLRYSKKLFIALNMLLKRNDYLKNSVYGENGDEVAQDDEEGDEE